MIMTIIAGLIKCAFFVVVLLWIENGLGLGTDPPNQVKSFLKILYVTISISGPNFKTK